MRRIFLPSQTIFLFNFLNIAFIISVFIHAVGFEKYCNPCGVVLSRKPLKYQWDVDLSIVIVGSLPPPPSTKSEILSLSLAILQHRHSFFMSLRVLLGNI